MDTKIIISADTRESEREGDRKKVSDTKIFFIIIIYFFLKVLWNSLHGTPVGHHCVSMLLTNDHGIKNSFTFYKLRVRALKESDQ